ncbi:hypothetical protein ACDY96_27080 [Rhizobium mongolense]|uniref:hypothetical protein n=1 Tax=Rhizobium mongolense TaxID=57676 RepID=UPI003556B9A9
MLDYRLLEAGLDRGNRQYVTTLLPMPFPIYLVHRVVPELKGSAGSALPLPALHLLAIAGGIIGH